MMQHAYTDVLNASRPSQTWSSHQKVFSDNLPSNLEWLTMSNAFSLADFTWWCSFEPRAPFWKEVEKVPLVGWHPV